MKEFVGGFTLEFEMVINDSPNSDIIEIVHGIIFLKHELQCTYINYLTKSYIKHLSVFKFQKPEVAPNLAGKRIIFKIGNLRHFLPIPIPEKYSILDTDFYFLRMLCLTHLLNLFEGEPKRPQPPPSKHTLLF